MSKITVAFQSVYGGDFSEELKKLQKKAGLSTVQVSKAVAELLKADSKTEGAFYENKRLVSR